MNNQGNLNIDGRLIGHSFPPYIVAEISANHDGEIDKAFELIRQAKISGADAVKLQTYRADTITLKHDSEDFQIRSGPWAGRTLFELYQVAHTPWEWHKALFDFAKDCGITIFSSPFDFTAVDLLEDLGTPIYKIASFEIVDIPLIKYVAKTGKPMIISTGMATKEEISRAVDAARDQGCPNVALLQCVSAYPASESDYNLSSIPDLIQTYGCVVGISDHTLGNTTAVTSVAVGARIIEKHLTKCRADGGPDAHFSMEPPDLAALCEGARSTWIALGRPAYGPKPSEVENLKFRRSLYFCRDLKAGQIVGEDSIRSVRPSYGISPRFYDEILGRRLAHDVAFGKPVTWEDFE